MDNSPGRLRSQAQKRWLMSTHAGHHGIYAPAELLSLRRVWRHSRFPWSSTCVIDHTGSGAICARFMTATGCVVSVFCYCDSLQVPETLEFQAESLRTIN
jgi:hypothetical protein